MFALLQQPPSISEKDSEALFSLLALIADEKGSKARAEHLIGLTRQASEAVTAANQTRADLAKERAAHADALAAERTAHNDALAKEKPAAAGEHSRRSQQLDEREAAVATREARVNADAEQIAAAKAEIARKQKILQSLQD
jgi:hypothetical protein